MVCVSEYIILVMKIFTKEELIYRGSQRAAVALYSFWEEQRYDPRYRNEAGVHSRIFDALIPDVYIELNSKALGRGRKEHVVPCAYIRNLSFKMYHENASIDDVAKMISKLLKIAYITEDQRKKVDSIHKYSMPENWNWKTDSILERLVIAGVEVVNPKNSCDFVE